MLIYSPIFVINPNNKLNNCMEQKYISMKSDIFRKHDPRLLVYILKNYNISTVANLHVSIVMV